MAEELETPDTGTATTPPPSTDSGQAMPPDPTLKTRPPVSAGTTTATPSTAAWTSAAMPPTASSVAPSQPKVMVPLKRHGFLGVMDEMSKFLMGTQGSEIYIDQATGQKYYQPVPMTSAQRWAKIGLEAAAGAAQGLAAGRGHGPGAAAAAGIQGGIEQRLQSDKLKTEEAWKEYAAQRQAKLDKMTLETQQMQKVEMQMRINAMQQTATKDMIKLSEDEAENYTKMGGHAIPGLYHSTNYQDIAVERPDVWDSHFEHANIMSRNVYDANGKPMGVQFWEIPQDWRNQPAPQGSQFQLFVRDDSKQGYHNETRTMPEGSTLGALQTARDAYATDLSKWTKEQQEKTALAKTQFEVEHQPEAFKTEQHLKQEQAFEAHEKGVAAREAAGGGGGNFNLTGEAFLASIPPQYQNRVRGIAAGNIPMPAAARGGKENVAISNYVMGYDPGYSTARYQGKQNFKTAGDATQLANLTTYLGHLEDLKQASKELGTAPLYSLDWSQAARKYNNVKKIFTEESGKLIANKALTVTEYEDLKKGLDSMFQGRRDAVIDNNVQLVRDRVHSAAQKYQTAVGRPLPVYEFFDQTTRDRLQRNNVMDMPTPPQGASRTAPDEYGTYHWTDDKGTDLGVIQ